MTAFDPARNRLIQTLRRCGQAPLLMDFADGSALVLLPFGGRMLGLFHRDSSANFLWTNPALSSPARACAFFQSSTWPNSGGDRVWVAPEVDVFLPAFPETSPYCQPRALDPGCYRVEQRSGSIRLRNRFCLRFSRSQATHEFEIVKHFEPAANPLRHEDAPWRRALLYAGYRQSVRFALGGLDPLAQGPSGLWSLLQLPHGGEMLIPIHGQAKPRVFLGRISPQEVSVHPDCVRFRMQGNGVKKIGLRAACSTGRMGYLFRRKAPPWDLVIRQFSVNRSGEYIDVPWDGADEGGYCMQACSVHDRRWGRFSEMEYHAPAIGRGTGRDHCLDCSRVWAFRGPPDAIEKAVEYLLFSK